jgi:hypothetical protein
VQVFTTNLPFIHLRWISTERKAEEPEPELEVEEREGELVPS